MSRLRHLVDSFGRYRRCSYALSASAASPIAATDPQLQLPLLPSEAEDQPSSSSTSSAVLSSASGPRDAMSAAKRLVQDMRLAIGRARDTGDFVCVQASELETFLKRARGLLLRCGFDASVEVFYWLSKCSQGAGLEVDEQLMLSYTAYVRSQALLGAETQLVRVLRALFGVLNRNKIARALETDAQLQMERVCHELMAAAMPRFCTRHRHLSLSDLSTVLSVYAKLFRKGYTPLFDAFRDDAVTRAGSPLVVRSDQHRLEFFLNGPFVLVAYAQAGCTCPEVFAAYLHHFQDAMDEMPYELLAVVAYSVARSGLDSASFWRQLSAEISASGSDWSVRALGRVIGACRKCLQTSRAHQGGIENEEEVVTLMQVAGLALLRRSQELTFHEATDLVMALALLPVSLALAEESLALLRCSCSLILNSHADFPPSYLAGALHSLVAIHMEPAFVDAHNSAACPVLPALRKLCAELRTQLCLCQPQELELVAQALGALAASAAPELAQELGVDTLLLVQQREAVRKANEFTAASLVRFVRLTEQAAEAFASRSLGRPPLLPWFLTEVQAAIGEAQLKAAVLLGEDMAFCYREGSMASRAYAEKGCLV